MKTTITTQQTEKDAYETTVNDKIIWMGHAGHFICGNECHFRLNTYVNRFIVSTVGELPDPRKEGKLMEIGLGRNYETMVFKGVPSGVACCPYKQVDGDNLDFDGYNTAEAALAGHNAMVEKYRLLGRKTEP